MSIQHCESLVHYNCLLCHNKRKCTIGSGEWLKRILFRVILVLQNRKGRLCRAFMSLSLFSDFGWDNNICNILYYEIERGGNTEVIQTLIQSIHEPDEAGESSDPIYTILRSSLNKNPFTQFLFGTTPLMFNNPIS